MKKIIVISTSLRHGSNSDMLADKFVEGAKAAGNEVEKISLVGKNIQFCKGCFGCQKLGRCVINDDVNDIMAKVLKADVICWATPIYYYRSDEDPHRPHERYVRTGLSVPRCLYAVNGSRRRSRHFDESRSRPERMGGLLS